jgi:hypothetical protein
LLWVAAENDHFFGPRLVAQLTAAFSNAGGNVTFVKTLPFGSYGHQLFDAASGIPIRSPIVDRVLAPNNLVLRDDGRSVTGCETAIYAEWSRPRGACNLSCQWTQQGLCCRRRFTFRLATGRRTTEQAVKDALGFCLPAAKCTIVNVNGKPADKF